jgi:FSR family fosmidomycin resistance protein-like MFS transporter
MRRLFIPITIFTLLRNFLVECLVTYLPVYMDSKGASLWVAGASLSILEVAGVAGALSSGTFSDRLGRKTILLIATLASAVIAFLFLNLEGWVLVPVLLALGFTALSTTPVLLAMVQDHLPEHRALGNGIYMLISFALRPIAIMAIGFIGDTYGLTAAFYVGAVLSVLAAPAVLLLPDLHQ